MRKERPDGFTLLELMLAVVVMALVMSIVAAVISGVLGGSVSVAESLSADAAGGEIEDIIAGDLAFLTAPAKDGGVEIREEGGGISSLSFYSACGSRTAWSASGDVPVTIHHVTYEVKTMPSGAKTLFRGEEPLVATRDAYYDAPVVLADSISGFTVEATDGQEWYPKWPAGRGGPVPAMFRVRVEFAEPGGATRSLVIESAPAIEVAPKPEAERRASGGEEGATNPQGGANSSGTSGRRTVGPTGGGTQTPPDVPEPSEGDTE
jgi:prepilin-type N-terminal cleavage/methylation domain-containing protein